MLATARPSWDEVCRHTAESIVPMISGVQLRADPNSQIAPAAAVVLAAVVVPAAWEWVLLWEAKPGTWETSPPFRDVGQSSIARRWKGQQRVSQCYSVNVSQIKSGHELIVSRT